MKKILSFSCLLLAAMSFSDRAWAQNAPDNALHVVKSSVNAEADNAEFCLEFDRPLAALSPARLATLLHLEKDNKKITPQNVAATGNALCLFPLERDRPYHLEISGLRGAADEKMAGDYSQSFTIPDRSPSLAFVGKNGGVNGFGSYDNALSLRAVNVDHVRISVYRVTDMAALARAWQDRAQTALAPSESVYLAKSKGQQVWQNDQTLDTVSNIASEQKFSLHDALPDLAPGLYLMIADAGHEDEKKPANKGLAPLAATWFTKSDFSLRALRDDDGIHVLASKISGDIHLTAMNRKQEPLAEAQNGADGTALIPWPPKLADKNDVATIIGTDDAGHIAFADIESLPPLANPPALGALHTHDLFAVPGDAVDVTAAMPENAAHFPDQSVLRLLRGDSVYADFPVPSPASEQANLSFPAPAAQGAWNLRWQKKDGTILAETPLRVTVNADAPHLEVASEKDSVSADMVLPVTITSVTTSGRPAVLTGGHVVAAWQRLDPATIGWKDYAFGVPSAVLNTPLPIATFLTDLQGSASLRLNLPKPPAQPGLYQAVVTIVADADTGIADARPFILPLHPESAAVGIKPLAVDARFAQNGIARFALAALDADGKAHDMSGLSYQIYEAGRSFAWYQNEGHWKYKPEPQLRPIGGGALAIKADNTSLLEWPVTAGNYRLEILDQSGKKLAQTDFSAGWNALPAPAPPLNVTMPKILQPDHEAQIHVSLPEPAMLTVIIADQHMRKIIHEFHDKGDAVIGVTPAADWQKVINVMIEAASPDGAMPPRRARIEAALAQDSPVAASDNSFSLIASGAPAAMSLRQGDQATLTFGLENNGSASETYHYAFTGSAGLKIEKNDKGVLTLKEKQSRAFTVAVAADQPGVKDLRLEVTTDHATRLSRSWAIDILPKDDALRSKETMSVAANDAVLKTRPSGEVTAAFVSQQPMDGLAEILSLVLHAHPFTTAELSLGIDALRLWGDVMAQSGLASEGSIKARRQIWLQQLLRQQNEDGGFAGLRGGDSAMEQTATALTALSGDPSPEALPARNLAIGWLKQRLANTWFDDKERPARAAAYAALAAADAVDIASLHYFSDTSATETLPPIAEANIAAAFKHIRDPNAAAFWIKKMLDEKGDAKTIPLLNALSATDALSSDQAHGAMAAMILALRRGVAPDFQDAAALLRAIAADNADAGKWILATAAGKREISGLLVLPVADPALLSYHNGNKRPLSVTLVAAAPDLPLKPPGDGSVNRHIYRLNGVELSAQTKPSPDEIYLVELRGSLPTMNEDEKILLQDTADSALRPMGCPLPAQTGILNFMPWLTLDDVTPSANCALAPYMLSVILSPSQDNDSNAFRVLYFAHIDAASVGDLTAAAIKIINISTF